MEKGTTNQEIVIFGKRTRVQRENRGCVSDEHEKEKGAKRTYTKSLMFKIHWRLICI